MPPHHNALYCSDFALTGGGGGTQLVQLFGVRLREGSVPGQLNTLTAIAAIGRSPAVRSDAVVRDGLRNICIAPVLNLRLVG